MGKSRSPNYPALTLGEAIEAVKPAFIAEKRNKMARLMLAKHLGYTSLNGRALGKIGALRAYGLVEGSGDELRVTEDAITLLNAPEHEPERAQALMRCALKPALFQQLHDEYPTPPSMENLRYALIKWQFTPEAAEKAAKTYLDTMVVVSGNNGGYSRAEFSSESRPMRPASIMDARQPPPKRGIERAEFPLPEGIVRLEFPSDLSVESYGDLEEWMKLILRRAKRSVATDKEE